MKAVMAPWMRRCAAEEAGPWLTKGGRLESKAEAVGAMSVRKRKDEVYGGANGCMKWREEGG